MHVCVCVLSPPPSSPWAPKLTTHLPRVNPPSLPLVFKQLLPSKAVTVMVARSKKSKTPATKDTARDPELTKKSVVLLL